MPISQSGGENLGLRGSCKKHSLTRVLYFFAEAIAITDPSQMGRRRSPTGDGRGLSLASAEAKRFRRSATPKARAVQSEAKRSGANRRAPF